MLIVDGRRWACQVIDLVYFHIERERNVMPDHFEVLVIKQMLDITARAGEEIVDADDDRSAASKRSQRCDLSSACSKKSAGNTAR